MGLRQANEVDDDFLMPWLTVTEQDMKDAEATGEPDGQHIFIIGSGRFSSHPGAMSYNDLVHDMPDNIRTYIALLRSPQYDTPLGNAYLSTPAMVFRTLTVVVAGQGTRPLPCQLSTHLTQPFLINLINAMFDQQTGVMRTNNTNEPDEIHFLNNGLAAPTVDVQGFGDFTRGLSERVCELDTQNGTTIADRIYIVPHVQSHVVDGVGRHSLHWPNPSPHWVGWRYQNLQKRKLKSLIMRLDFVENNASLVVNRQPPNPRPAGLHPHWDNDARNDDFLKAWKDE